MKDRTTVAAVSRIGEILATAGLEYNELWTPQICDVVTDPRFRRAGFGYGRAVVEEVEKIARGREISCVQLYPTKPAEGFYHKLGYVQQGKGKFTKDLTL